MENGSQKQLIRFAEFEIDTGRRRLVRSGAPVALSAKTFDLLLFLLAANGRVVPKEEILDAVWAEQFVEEANLTVQISALRKALGETKNEPRFLVTIPGVGYKFIADIESEADDEIIIEKHKIERVVVDAEISETQNRGVKRLTAGKTPRRKAIFVLAGTALLVLAGFVLYKYFIPAPKTQIKSIAVLPFKPLVAENRNESLEMGMADTLIAKLSNFREINVRPITAVRKYTGIEQDAVAAGREQQVDAVLDGQIQQSDGKIRMTVRLIKTDDGTPVWTNQFDEKWTDIFAVQDSISERIAGFLALKLSAEEQQQLKKRPTESAEAYQLYLMGRFYWNKRTDESFDKAAGYFERAIEQDPRFALAYVGLADSYLLGKSGSLAQALKAKAAVEKALEIDAGVGEAHSTLAYIQTFAEWNFAGAEKEHQLAIRLSPNYATAHHWYAEFLALSGRFEESFAEYNRALELDPLSLAISTDLGKAYYFARQNDRAVEHFKKLIALDPNYVRTYFYLARVYAEKGMFDETLDEYEKGYALTGADMAEFSKRKTAIKNALRATGARGFWQAVIEFSKNESRQSGTALNPVEMAARYASLGERDEAFRLLERAYEERYMDLISLKVAPEFDNLRDDPRFQVLLGKVGFPR